MKENSALFLKALMEQSIPYKLKNTRMDSTFSFDFALNDRIAQAHVTIFNDDNGLRLLINDFFIFDPELLDAVLDIINAAPERAYATIYALGDEVYIRKEITTVSGFSTERVLSTLDELSGLACSLVEKLELVYSVLS